MYSIGDFAALILKSKIGENKFMKNLMRMLVVAGLLVMGIYGQITFSGPGTPAEPPVAVIL